MLGRPALWAKRSQKDLLLPRRDRGKPTKSTGKERLASREK